MKSPVTLDLGEVEAEASISDGAISYVYVEGGGESCMLLPYQLIALMGKAAYESWAARVVQEAGEQADTERAERNARVMMGCA